MTAEPRRPPPSPTALVRLLALLAPAVLLLGACGIPATGVVDAGEPATGVRPAALVYFLRDGAVVAVPRRTVSPVGVGSALVLLEKGPTEPERYQGLSSDLPPGTALSAVTEAGGQVWIGLPPAVGPLTGAAVEQLVCTAAAAATLLGAAPGTGTVRVVVTNSGGWQSEGDSETCPGL